MSQERRPTPPGRASIAYFGLWCRQGWSAGVESDKPLTPAQIAGAVIKLKGSGGNFRESPIDAACKRHDIAYDFISQMRDPIAKRRATLDADRRLLDDVARSLDDNVKGKVGLNAGEVIYSQDVQIWFNTMMVINGVVVGKDMVVGSATRAQNAFKSEVRRQTKEDFRKLRFLASILVYQNVPGSNPYIARLYNPSGR